MNAYCNDTIGSYSCACSAGYDGDGFFCDGKEVYHVSILNTPTCKSAMQISMSAQIQRYFHAILMPTAAILLVASCVHVCLATQGMA